MRLHALYETLWVLHHRLDALAVAVQRMAQGADHMTPGELRSTLHQLANEFDELATMVEGW